MSVSPLTSILNHHASEGPPRRLPRRTSSFNMPSNILGSLKKTFSKRGSNPNNPTDSADSSASKSHTSTSGRLAPPASNNPFTSSSPATRRPDRPGMNAFSAPSNEPPPAYTPGPSVQVPVQPASIASSDDDPYGFLATFDTVFLIDDSGSMAGRSWRETSEALSVITPICTKRDADGIDIYFLNHPDSSLYKNVKSAGTIIEIFQTVKPRGGTPTGQRLHNILKAYMRKYEADKDGTKPINIIVITDGTPTDDVEAPIIWAAKKLDRLDAPAWQVGIQFFQVGEEPEAEEALKELDDALAEKANVRDMVDTVPFTGGHGQKLNPDGIMKVVLGSVNRKLDRGSKTKPTHS